MRSSILNTFVGDAAVSSFRQFMGEAASRPSVAQYAPIISSPQTSPRKNNALNTPLPLSLSSSTSAAAAAAAAASFYPNDFSTFANESKSHKIRKWVSKIQIATL
jgi:hypothetical protein